MIRMLLLAGLVTFSLSATGAGRVFYDGFEDGTTTLWSKDDYRNKCQVVSASKDGVAGPFAGSKMASCNWNGTVAWNDPAAFENLVLTDAPYTSELFLRIRVRIDKNVERTANSATKLLRVYQGASGAYNELYSSAWAGTNGFVSAGNAGTKQLTTYWGGKAGDFTNQSAGWHKVERYTNQVTGSVREWHDGVLVRDDVAPFTGRWFPFYIASNWADAHDAANNAYFDEVEVYSDTGTGATGLMSDATIAVPVTTTPPPADCSALQAQVTALQAQVSKLTTDLATANAKIAAALPHSQAATAALQ